MAELISEPTWMNSDCPMNDFRSLVHNVPGGNEEAAEQVYKALLSMGRPNDFGKLARLAAKIARWQGTYPPRAETPVLAMFASAHGSAAENITFSTDEETKNNIALMREGKAPLTQIAAAMGADIRVFDLAVDAPTQNILHGPAMTAKECAATLAFGFEAIEGQPDILALGVNSAGVGTIAAGLACQLYGGSPEYWLRVGFSASVNFARDRAGFVTEILNLHQGEIQDPLDALARIGGREIAACVGAIIAARMEKIPVIIDGFATSVAAGILHAMNPAAIDHVFAAHITQRPAHEAVLERMRIEPLLRMEFQTGGGLGSVTAIGLAKAACAPFQLVN